ncbi:MAG: hypothetical protein LBM62_03675, partial [Mediterranea sp.]|nr:hypothetical protein [Mediterranea sp.]
MRSIIKTLAGIVTAVFLMTGCESDYIDALDGRYPAPEEYTLTSLVSHDVVKQGGGKRIITVKLSGDASAQLSVDFVTNAYNLLPAGYTIATADKAANGNYIGATSTFNGKAVTAGIINVTLTGESHYTIGGTLQLADDTFVRISYEGDIVFELDPPVVTYKLETQTPYFYTTDGMNYSPLENSKVNKITVYADGALVGYFEIVVAADKTSLAGTYPVSGTIADTNGAVVRGTYVNLPALGWGTDIITGGSYIVDNGTLYLNGGTLTIAESSGALSFSSSDLTIIDTADSMGSTALPGTKSFNYANATSFYTYSNAVTIPYAYTQDGTNFTNVEGTQLNAITVLAGTAVVGYFEVVS